jgi:hypothetical protein
MKDLRAVVQENLFRWFDEALSNPLPDSIIAFHVNLYEGMSSIHVQLVGTTSFSPGKDPERDYWPGEEAFSTREDIFEIPFSVAGTDWREWLATSKEMIRSYIDQGVQAERIRSSHGLGIGFVDGDMAILWQKGAS